jgi:pSer/pThr/pTyr-binding forkhead associated (FHA) protein
VSANPPAGAQAIAELKARVEAERAGRPFLVYLDADDRQRLFFFEPASAEATVGRLPSSDLVIDWDDQVSRLHAQFERTGSDWVLVDDGFSRNGTFVNGERLRGSLRLKDGDGLRFGTTTITFRAPEGRQIGPRAAPAGMVLSTTQRRVLAALCRPYRDGGGFVSPASDEQVAEELVLSISEVRAHLRVLAAKLGLKGLPPDESRVRLVELALSDGLISERDL